jgi:hypothetical protein
VSSTNLSFSVHLVGSTPWEDTRTKKSRNHYERRAMMTHDCNLSYVEGRHRRITVWDQPQQKSPSEK